MTTTDNFFAAPSAPEVSAKVQAIRDLKEAGFTLIPLKGKAPIEANWPDTPANRYDERNLLENYGVSLPADILVIDVDPRNYAPADDKPLARLVEALGYPAIREALKSTFSTRTGAEIPRRHYYLRKPANVQVKNSLREYPGLEFKAGPGRQMVGPGSTHPLTGKEYAVASGNPKEIAEAPTALLALILRAPSTPFEEVPNAPRGIGHYVSDAATQGRYVDYLEFAAPISGSYAVACRGRDLGLPPALTWELMVEIWNKRRKVPRTPEELRAKVVHAYKYATRELGAEHPEAQFKDAPVPPTAAATATPPPKEENADEWVTTKQGARMRCFKNLVAFLRDERAGLAGTFGYNEFTGRVEFLKPAPWHLGRMPQGGRGVSDNDLKLLKGHLAIRHGFEMPVGIIEEGVTVVAHAQKFHAVRDWLNGLTWDGTERLDFWLRDHLGVRDNPYTRACARKVLCAAVKRVFNPGCKFDHVLVLEGEQKIGKSTVVEILGAPWSGDFNIDPHNKDTVQLMQGRWIIELAEMEVTRRADLLALKAFITRRKDEARLAYGRTVGEFPRQSIFIGTINPEAEGTYLRDSTGNRRWWPVWCAPAGGRVKFEEFKAVRDQLFAEAVAAVKSGQDALYMEGDVELTAEAEAHERHGEHVWTEAIATWLGEKERAEKMQPEFVTAREVYLGALGGMDKQIDHRSNVGIATALHGLGWRRDVKRINGRLVRGYSYVVPVKVGKATV